MSPVLTTSRPTELRSPDRSTPLGTPGWQVAASDDAAIDGRPSSRGFTALIDAYRGTGGTARGDDLARLLEDHHRGDFVSLARHIVDRDVFAFEWREIFWVPMFQFDLGDLSIRPGPRQVLAELSNEFDGWALATWFAQPNTWLNAQRPLDLLNSNLLAVLDAARVDRFIAAG